MPVHLHRSTSWDDKSYLPTFVEDRFPRPDVERKMNLLLGSDLMAVNLERMSGIQITWTCNLEEHLWYDRDRRSLKVYSLKQVLQDQMMRYAFRFLRTLSLGCSLNMIFSDTKIIPESVTKETLLSLNLLFPNWDPRTERYLQKANQGFFAEATIKIPRQLYLMDFYHWQDRLAELHDESQSSPPSWKQLWTDRRNRLQWYTFWFAVAVLVLTVVFGTITSVTACMQTRYAYESLQLARTAAHSPITCLLATE